jgi:CubicO group peptidase (beta-lactamase class C family)
VGRPPRGRPTHVIDGDDRLGIGEALRAFVAIDPADGPRRSLGFDRPAPEGSSAGSLLGQAGPRGAIGHLGFTGCSLWIDLDRRLSVALLTNRTYPGRQHVEAIRALRPAFHDRLCRAIDR